MAVQETVTRADEGAVGVTPMVELRGVSKYYGEVTALKDVDFALMPGEIHGLVNTSDTDIAEIIFTYSGVASKDIAGTTFVEDRWDI